MYAASMPRLAARMGSDAQPPVGPLRFNPLPRAPSYSPVAPPPPPRTPPNGLVFTNAPYIGAADAYFSYALPTSKVNPHVLARTLRVAQPMSHPSRSPPGRASNSPTYSVRMTGEAGVRLQIARDEGAGHSRVFAPGHSAGALRFTWDDPHGERPPAESGTHGRVVRQGGTRSRGQRSALQPRKSTRNALRFVPHPRPRPDAEPSDEQAREAWAKAGSLPPRPSNGALRLSVAITHARATREPSPSELGVLEDDEMAEGEEGEDGEDGADDDHSLGVVGATLSPLSSRGGRTRHGAVAQPQVMPGFFSGRLPQA